ncbi:hypothetical protein [Noviherbaspirillum aerium]|uniref:hypothetical protein n=1 Tax=Noviherbaspirillum aerium TaxID=2588497 RepID=UPI001CEF98D3|nr:hypothetical protein [Noviherbaspirillum aerium]
MYFLKKMANSTACRHMLAMGILGMLAAMSGCASLIPPAVNAGDSASDLVAKRGHPTHRYRDGNEEIYEYMQGPWGQRTYMARLDATGRVKSFEQVLTSEKFASIEVGKATKDTVLRTIGAPSDTSYLPLRDLEVWSYPYKESNVWNSLMHVHFDRSGVVQQMMNGPDPRFDPDRRLPFAFGGLR